MKIFDSVIVLLMFSVGLLMAIHDFLGMAHQEGSGEVDIIGLGKVSGSTHLVIIFLGIVLMVSALSYRFRLHKLLLHPNVRGFVRDNVSKVTHSITDLGREIARRKRERKRG